MLNYIKLIFSLIVIANYSIAYSEPKPNCTFGPENRITNTTADTESGCSIQPTIQRIKFYKFALCSAEPTPPTTSTPVDSSRCTTVWENSSGSSIDIVKGVRQAFSGGTSTVPVGSFNYFYFEIDPILGTQAIANFDPPRTGSIENAGTGNTCWSVARNNPYYSERDDRINPLDGAANCGIASEANPGVSNQFINETGGGFNDVYTTSRGTALKYYLVKPNYTIPSGAPVPESPNGITKIIAWGPQNITINSELVNININYNNSQGSEVAFENGSDYPGQLTDGVEYLGAFGAGPFDLFISVTE